MKKTYNKTSNFILPLVGYSFNFFKPFLYDAYIHDSRISKKYPYCVYILFKFSGDKNYAIVEKTLLNNVKCKSQYDIHEGAYSMFILECEKRFKKDYSLLVSGKYSEISEEAKNIILQGRNTVKNKKGKNETSIVHKVLHKDIELKKFWEKRTNSDLKEQEVWSRLNSEEETFSKKLMDTLDKKFKIENEQKRTIIP